MGIIASGILAPTALAASPTLTDIFNKLTGVDTKVSSIKTIVDTNLDSKVSTRATPADVTNAKNAIIDNSGVKRVFGFHGSMNPGPGNSDVFEIIPASDGKVFTGHLTGNSIVLGAFGELTYAGLDCEVGDPISSNLFTTRLVDIDASHDFNVDFSCTHLSLTEGVSAPRDYDPASMQFWITGEYTESAFG